MAVTECCQFFAADAHSLREGNLQSACVNTDIVFSLEVLGLA